jgi:hypothetical protein
MLALKTIVVIVATFIAVLMLEIIPLEVDSRYRTLAKFVIVLAAALILAKKVRR